MSEEVLIKIDARNSSDADGNNYFIVFCSRKSENLLTKPGHAFVIWGIEDNQTQMSTQTSFGFYPDEDNEFKALFSTVPGRLVDEAKKQTPSRLFTARMIVQVNRESFFSSQSAIDDWKTSNYDLYSKNCMHFVREIALNLGLFPPTVTSFELPSEYLQKLIETTETRS